MEVVVKFKEFLAKVKAEHPKGKPLTARGAEVNDPTPMAPPVGYKSQPSMFEVIRELVAAEKARIAELEEFESPDEADDFDVGEDYDPRSPHEHDFDHVADPGELQRLRDQIDVRMGALRAAEAGGKAADPAPAKAEVKATTGKE